MKIKSHFSVVRRAFTLIEVMVAMALLSLIVLALMAVFNNTQAAFRASVTQTDVLEGGRAAMDLITGDLRAMSPSGGYTNGAVNFYVAVNNNFTPLVQSLVSSPSGSARTNVLQTFFILSRENQTWTGVGYVVGASIASDGNPLYPLYRFSMSTNVSAINGASALYINFAYDVNNSIFTNMSHLLDGVVGFRVRAYDPNGNWLTNSAYYNSFLMPKPGYVSLVQNSTMPINSGYGEVGFYMYSNTLPASVEIEMATLEDRTLQRAESFPTFQLQTNYLASQAGKVHVFRQRVAIPNVDPSVYQ